MLAHIERTQRLPFDVMQDIKPSSCVVVADRLRVYLWCGVQINSVKERDEQPVRWCFNVLPDGSEVIVSKSLSIVYCKCDAYPLVQGGFDSCSSPSE